MALGKLYKWLTLAIKTRKDDIVRRKAKEKKAREDRDKQIQLKSERGIKREKDVLEAEEKFKEEHKEEIEAALRGEEKNENEGDNDESKDLQPPVMPVFNKQEFLTQFDEQFPEIEIPLQLEPDVDRDWILSEEEMLQLIIQYN